MSEPVQVLDRRADRAAQLRAGVLVVAALALLGAILGVVWEAWSPPGPVGAVLAGGIQADETEAFAAGDGRFALIVAVVGLVAGVAAWTTLPRVRGPYIAVALAVGGAGGAALTEWVGYLIRGDGKTFRCLSETGRCIDHLPLTVHMHALLLVEAVVAVLVYSLFVAFAVADDLGRPDPARGGPDPLPGTWAPRPDGGYGDRPVTTPSVGPERDLQEPWRDGDAPGPA